MSSGIQLKRAAVPRMVCSRSTGGLLVSIMRGNSVSQIHGKREHFKGRGTAVCRPLQSERLLFPVHCKLLPFRNDKVLSACWATLGAVMRGGL